MGETVINRKIVNVVVMKSSIPVHPSRFHPSPTIGNRDVTRGLSFDCGVSNVGRGYLLIASAKTHVCLASMSLEF